MSWICKTSSWSVVFLQVLLLSSAIIHVHGSSSPCYPALFAFGNSLTDTGNARLSRNLIAYLLVNADVKPYGETYFGQPANRYSDGRVILDFLAQALGLPFLNPYLNISSPEIDYSHGVNYAVAGALANNITYFYSKRVYSELTSLTLEVQLGWHQNVRKIVASGAATNLPKQDDFKKALYFIEFGGNDYGAFVLSKRYSFAYIESEVVPRVIGELTRAVETLYQNEARNFIIVGVTPEGCTPLYLTVANGSKLDSYGCRVDMNSLNTFHNNQLQIAIQTLSAKYPDISITYADIFNAYQSLIQNPSTYGLTNVLDACCGAGPGYKYQFSFRRICGRRAVYTCPVPDQYAVWDGIHPTDKFNGLLVNKFISGQFVEPPNSLSACASPIAS